jgi:hypothetical protein
MPAPWQRTQIPRVTTIVHAILGEFLHILVGDKETP